MSSLQEFMHYAALLSIPLVAGMVVGKIFKLDDDPWKIQENKNFRKNIDRHKKTATKPHPQ